MYVDKRDLQNPMVLSVVRNRVSVKLNLHERKCHATRILCQRDHHIAAKASSTAERPAVASSAALPPLAATAPLSLPIPVADEEGPPAGPGWKTGVPPSTPALVAVDFVGSSTCTCKVIEAITSAAANYTDIHGKLSRGGGTVSKDERLLYIRKCNTVQYCMGQSLLLSYVLRFRVTYSFLFVYGSGRLASVSRP